MSKRNKSRVDKKNIAVLVMLVCLVLLLFGVTIVKMGA